MWMTCELKVKARKLVKAKARITVPSTGKITYYSVKSNISDGTSLWLNLNCAWKQVECITFGQI